jgi:U1 small nuclear ribonucleoprotein
VIFIKIILCFYYIVAIERGDGRRVDGRRVNVDYERGRTREDWLPRRLGGGKGDTRRNRDEEKLIRELKKSHPLLREKSRSRSRDKTKLAAANIKEEEKNANEVMN